MYCSAKLSPPVIEHTGSWLISIFSGAGGLPEKWTIPLTVPSVAGSSGTGAATESAFLPSSLPCLPASFALHPHNVISAITTTAAGKDPNILFMSPLTITLFLESRTILSPATTDSPELPSPAAPHRQTPSSRLYRQHPLSASSPRDKPAPTRPEFAPPSRLR